MAHTIWRPVHPVYIADAATAVGHEEHAGPLGAFFDLHDPKEDTFGMDTWEKAESEMQRLAVNTLLGRSSLEAADIRAIFAGDLLNQCTGSGYGLLSFDIPFFGLYGACSTIAEGLILASSLVSHNVFDTAAAVTSSHNCSAERQYRTPIEYGGQKPPTAQWTVTGAGAFVLGSEDIVSRRSGVRIDAALPGIVVDKGITDPNNMGAAMAPAAMDSLIKYFTATDESPGDFDLVLTGDLGKVGSEMLKDLMRAEGYDLSGVHDDCGVIIYKGLGHPDVNSGGSGCGCSAVVMGAHILHLLRHGELKRVLFLATGAMMSPSSVQQGLNIPAIGHIVVIESVPTKEL